MFKLINPLNWSWDLKILLITMVIYTFIIYLDFIDIPSKIVPFFLGRSVIDSVDTFLSFTGLVVSLYFAVVAFNIAQKEFSPSISILVDSDGTTKVKNNSSANVKIHSIHQSQTTLARIHFDEKSKKDITQIAKVFEDKRTSTKLKNVELGKEEEIVVLNSQTHVDPKTEDVEKLEDKDVWAVSTIVQFGNSLGQFKNQYIHAFIVSAKIRLWEGVRDSLNSSFINGLKNRHLYTTPLEAFLNYSDLDLKNIEDFNLVKESQGASKAFAKYWKEKDIKLNPENRWILIYKRRTK